MALEPPRVLLSRTAGEVERAGTPVPRHSPHDGTVLWEFVSADAETVASAVAAARAAQPGWAATAGPARGEAVRRLAYALEAHLDDVASVVARETGKAPREALDAMVEEDAPARVHALGLEVRARWEAAADRRAWTGFGRLA